MGMLKSKLLKKKPTINKTKNSLEKSESEKQESNPNIVLENTHTTINNLTTN